MLYEKGVFGKEELFFITKAATHFSFQKGS